MSLENQLNTLLEQTEEMEETLSTTAVLLESIRQCTQDLSPKNTFSYTNSQLNGMAAYAYYQCQAFHEVNFPKVPSVAISAFEGCTALQTFSAAQTTYLEDNAFSGCSGLVNISIPACEQLDSRAFNGCSSLYSADLRNVKSIGANCFFYCTGLTSIILDAIATIGENAFYSCSSLNNLILPTTLEGIGPQAFDHCTNLTTLSYEGTSYQWRQIEGHDLKNHCPNLKATTIYCMGDGVNLDLTVD